MNNKICQYCGFVYNDLDSPNYPSCPSCLKFQSSKEFTNFIRGDSEKTKIED